MRIENYGDLACCFLYRIQIKWQVDENQHDFHVFYRAAELRVRSGVGVGGSLTWPQETWIIALGLTVN